MTGFYSAGYGTIDLFWLSFECVIASGANLVGIAPRHLVRVFTATGTTSQRFASSGCSALLTVLRIFSRGAECTPMHLFMAGHAQGDSVFDIKGEFGMLRQWFNVVCVDFVRTPTAMLACVIVPPVDRFSPFLESIAKLPAQSLCCFATFPYWRSISCFPVYQAFMRAKSSASINGIKLTAACIAGFDKGIASIVPARLRTPFGGRCSMHGNFKDVAAELACFGYAVTPILRTVWLIAFHRAKPLIAYPRMKSFAAMFAGSFLKCSLVEVVTLKESRGFAFLSIASWLWEWLTATAFAKFCGRGVRGMLRHVVSPPETIGHATERFQSLRWQTYWVCMFILPHLNEYGKLKALERWATATGKTPVLVT